MGRRPLRPVWICFSASWGKEGYGAQAKNTKELGSALKLAGVTSVRKTVGNAKKLVYVLPPSEDETEGEDLQYS